MARIVKPPAALSSLDPGERTVFLAGSIDMGRAELWQDRVAEALAGVAGTVLNPRRDDWSTDWGLDLADARLAEQIAWELDGLERADLVAMYLAPETRSPVSLLELGLHARSGRLVVCCPAGFWRKGNVDAVCRRYGVTQVDTLDALITAVCNALQG